jgi:homeobox-leucine zipper protein
LQLTSFVAGRIKVRTRGAQLLHTENDNLRAENARYKEALANVTCPSCGGPATAVIGEMSFDEQHLRL